MAVRLGTKVLLLYFVDRLADRKRTTGVTGICDTVAEHPSLRTLELGLNGADARAAASIGVFSLHVYMYCVCTHTKPL